MKNQFLARARLVTSLFIICAILIVVRVVHIQNSPEADDIRSRGEATKWADVVFFPERGRIYDRQGYMLAGNKTVYEVGVTLKNIKNIKSVATNLSAILEMDYDTILNNITNPPEDQVYLVINQFVPADRAKRLISLQEELAEKATGPESESLAGVDFTPRTMRSYPEKTLASNIIGFVNQQNIGNYGIEQKYDSLLAGVPLTIKVPQDPNLADEMPKIPAGTDLILTIDRDIQLMVETVLQKGVDENDAVAGTIVVMDPRTGEILAMASTPQMDLNDYTGFYDVYESAGEFNRAISMQYEPGSVFKILTMAAAIDTNLVTPSTTYLDTGFYSIGGHNIMNWNYGAWGVQTMVGCLQHSLNVCMAHLADLMGKDTFYRYMQRFGIGHPTGIDLANETNGRLKNPADDDWYDVDLGTNSFGQGVAVTPIQMLTAASALANDGKMVYPHVVYAMVNNGDQHNTPVQTLGTPISPQAARTVSNMLADAIEGGEAIGVVENYRLAGKTGTASIPGKDGRYDDELTNASFIGWGPVDDPKFMVYVWLERPEKSEWASLVAAPVFREVVKNLVVLMDIPPDGFRNQLQGQ